MAETEESHIVCDLWTLGLVYLTRHDFYFFLSKALNCLFKLKYNTIWLLYKFAKSHKSQS